MKSPTLNFPEWAPDISSLGTNVSSVISGCVPRADGFGPFKSLQEFTQALPARCRGYFFARRSDGSIAVYAGTQVSLYLLDNNSFAWIDVSKGGVPYSPLVSTDNWRFAQFNDLVIAVQANTVPQKFILSSGTTFVDLGGSPPQAAHIAIINRFVVLTGLVSASRRVQWSDLDAPETWTAGVGLSDFQDLPDGGSVHQISGGDNYGLIYQDEPIRSLVYAPGSAYTFQITRISQNDPIYAQYSPINAGDRTFFITAQGFKMVQPGDLSPKAIGKERIDRTFFSDVDTGNLQLVIGAADPTATRVFWAYKSQQGQAGLFDKVLCYDWSIGKNGEWSLLPISGEYLAALAKPGLTLEQLDAIAPTPLPITGAANNGAGLIRLTLAGGLSNADFAIAGQNFIVVQGVTGTVEANGTWVVDSIDATHIDLLRHPDTGVASAFVHAYVSGGAIGGSLDALPFSLDSISVASIAALSAISSNHMAGFFNGPNIEAILETSEQDLEGHVVAVNNTRPITDASAGLVSIGCRMTAQAVTVYSAESAINDDGEAPVLVETRYAKARLRIPAESVWSYARGIQPDVGAAGSY